MKFPLICSVCEQEYAKMTDATQLQQGGVGFCSHAAAGNSPVAGVYYCVIPIIEGGYQVTVMAPVTIVEAKEMAAEVQAVGAGDDTPRGVTVQ